MGLEALSFLLSQLWWDRSGEWREEGRRRRAQHLPTSLILISLCSLPSAVLRNSIIFIRRIVKKWYTRQEGFEGEFFSF